MMKPRAPARPEAPVEAPPSPAMKEPEQEPKAEARAGAGAFRHFPRSMLHFSARVKKHVACWEPALREQASLQWNPGTPYPQLRLRHHSSACEWPVV